MNYKSKVIFHKFHTNIVRYNKNYDSILFSTEIFKKRFFFLYYRNDQTFYSGYIRVN